MATVTANRWLLHIGLMVLFIGEISAQGCSQLRSSLQEANKGYLVLLKHNMGSTIPSQCIEDAIEFSSNEENLMNIEKLQEDNAKVAIHEIFQQIYHIFNQNHTEMAWDEQSMRDFMNGLDQEIEKLGSCLSAGRYTYNIRRTVKRHFQRFNSFLKEKEYAMCAWKIIQKKVEQCLGLTDHLIKRIESQA